MKLEELKKIYDKFDIKELFSEQEVEEQCVLAAKWINKNYKDKHPIIIGTLKGALPFMSAVLKHLTIPVTVDYIMVKSYYNNAYSTNVKIYKDVDLEIADRDVIIMEDIIDTGKTLKKIADIFGTRDVKSIAYMTLIQKTVQETKVKVDFVGFTTHDEFLVGFGLDYSETYRELPYIAEMIFKDKKTK